VREAGLIDYALILFIWAR
jgi:aarF domain-containing kinase